jgi:hypothetical protein
MGSVSTGSDGAPLTAAFPGINMVRVYDTNYSDPSAYQTFVQQLTALKIELNWYQSLATAFVDNPYVWLGSNNEPSYNPSLAALSTWHQQTYGAIRGTGNKSMIMIDEPAGGNPGTMGPGFGLTASVYAAMTNVVWDFHEYGWSSNYSTSQAAVDADLQGSVASGSGILAALAMPTGDGTAPLIIGEYGDSTNGNDIDANWVQVITAVTTSGYGSTAWAYPNDGGGGGDNLTDGNGNLTSFGQMVANFIKLGP